MLRDGGINEILLAVEPYRREKRPLKDKEEEEYVFELCNILSSCLVDPAAKARFVEDQGVELMMLVMKGRQFYRIGVVKVRAPEKRHWPLELVTRAMPPRTSPGWPILYWL
jgi:hypothetical protein